MTKQFLITLVLTAFSLAAWSDNHDKEHGDGPCKKIKDACVAAGFEKGKHKEKKGLKMDCMKPIMNGETVAGVTVSPEDLSACKEKKEQRKEKKSQKKEKKS